MSMLATPKFHPAPSIMLVALDNTLVGRLTEMAAPLPVLRVVHVQAARERLPVTRPLAVVVGSDVDRSELDMLQETASGVGAELLQLREPFDAETVRKWLSRAIVLAHSRWGK